MDQAMKGLRERLEETAGDERAFVLADPDLLRAAAAALARLEALEAQMRAEFPTSLIRATIYGSFGLANGVLEEQDYDGNWHEVAWSEDDRRPMEALAELLAAYEPIGATPAPAGTPTTTDQT